MSRYASLVLVFSTVLGCGVGPGGKPGNGVSISKDDLASVDTTREALRHFAHRYFVNIQGATVSIVERAQDIKTRKHAVLWRLFAAEQGRDAAFRQNVLAALVDMWVLCVQMREFFDTGEGHDAFGEHTHLALGAAKEIEADVDRVATAILPAGRADEVRDSVRKFSAKHPIRLPFARDSDVSFLAQAEGEGKLNWMYDASLSPLRAIGGMDETAVALGKLARVGSQTNLIASYLPDNVRLQTQLLLYDPEVQSALASVEKVSESADRMSATAERLPEEISRQVERVLEELKKNDDLVNRMLTLLTTFVADLQKASLDVGQAGVAWEGTTKAIHDMVNDFRGKGKGEGEDAPDQARVQPAVATDPAKEAAPYDINDYGKAAKEIAEAAVQLRGVTAEVKSLLTSDTPAVVTAAGEIEGLVNRVALFGALLIVAFFGGLIVYRVVAVKLAKK